MFERAPSAKAQSLIKAALPLPVTTFARFKDDILSFGSDDLLEMYIKAAYEPPHAKKPFKQAVRDVKAIAEAGNWSEKVLFPATKYWKAFCDHFERAMLDIHAIAPLKLALKPDDQDGDKAGQWHQWSVLESHRLVERALKSDQKTPAALAYLTINVLESISDRLVKRMSPHARKVWLAWIDRMQTSGPRDVRDEYEDFAVLLFDSFKKSEREDVLASLSKSMRASLAEQADDR